MIRFLFSHQMKRQSEHKMFFARLYLKLFLKQKQKNKKMNEINLFMIMKTAQKSEENLTSVMRNNMYHRRRSCSLRNDNKIKNEEKKKKLI
jgi:hypothetical protein